MPTRRQFLQSTASLVASPYLAGQASACVFPYTQNPTPDTRDVTFADFESGTYEGWTLAGNCWTKEPHSAETIKGITGFQGKRFLCTLHPTLGNNATGKAVSREFTIEKPFINFLIGGGNHPGEACLNLVVDGKVVRTETGGDRPDLKPASWDVTDLIGKMAHLEVVDQSAGERGYVMVDDLKLLEFPPPIQQANVFAGLTPDQKILINLFLSKATDDRLRRGGKPDYGCSIGALLETGDLISYRMIQSDMDHKARRSFMDLSTLIKSGVEDVIAKLAVKPNGLMRERLMVQGVCDWVRTHIRFDPEVVSHYTKEYWTPRSIMDRSDPNCVCAGFTHISSAIANLIGLNCVDVSGYISGARVFNKLTHSWNVFTLADGTSIPADTSWTPVTLSEARRRLGHIRNPMCLPIYREEWGMFLSQRYGSADWREDTGDLPTKHGLQDITYDEWRQINTRILDGLCNTKTNWQPR